MYQNNNKLLERYLSGRYPTPFSYTYPTTVVERAITKCSGYVPGSKKLTTNK